jgi:hypothetical protein
VRPTPVDPEVSEPLAVLLLPRALESFELAGHARELLAIPRVIALEPSRFRTPRLLRDAAPLRSARRLRFPGLPRVFVLYHPAQYRLARAMLGRYDGAELWYVCDEPVPHGDLAELDQLARERAGPGRLLAPDPASAAPGAPLRARLQELGIISPHPFVPGGRISRTGR